MLLFISLDLAHRLDSLDSRYLLQLREIELLKERLNKATSGEKENQEILQDQILTPPPPLHGVSPLKDNTEERLQLLEDKHAKLHAEQAFTSVSTCTLCAHNNISSPLDPSFSLLYSQSSTA